MASRKLQQMLNKAISGEIQVSIQYMWQHVQWIGVKGFAVKDELKQIAVQEMKHAEKIAERLFYLGGTPTTQPTPINVGRTLRQMIQQDIKDEAKTIDMYKGIVEMAEKEDDVTTAFIFKQILEDEEDHHDTFTTLLEEL